MQLMAIASVDPVEILRRFSTGSVDCQMIVMYPTDAVEIVRRFSTSELHQFIFN